MSRGGDLVTGRLGHRQAQPPWLVIITSDPGLRISGQRVTENSKSLSTEHTGSKT